MVAAIASHSSLLTSQYLLLTALPPFGQLGAQERLITNAGCPSGPCQRAGKRDKDNRHPARCGGSQSGCAKILRAAARER